MLKSLMVIAVGASLGAWLRWILGMKLNALFPTIPPGTVVANMVGGYIIGLAIAFLAASPTLSPEWRLLIITGFCGGLVTVRPCHLPSPAKPRHRVHSNLSEHQI